MITVKSKVVLERTLALDLPENTSDEDIIKEAEKEIISPIYALNQVRNILQRSRIDISKIDLQDWSLTDSKYEIIK